MLAAEPYIYKPYLSKVLRLLKALKKELDQIASAHIFEEYKQG
jgi:hypothetical protein